MIVHWFSLFVRLFSKYADQRDEIALTVKMDCDGEEPSNQTSLRLFRPNGSEMTPSNPYPKHSFTISEKVVWPITFYPEISDVLLNGKHFSC